MNPQERIAALEGMLERIKRNVDRPRPLAFAPSPAPAPAAAAAATASSTFDQTVDELLEAPIPLIHTTPATRQSAPTEPLSIEPPPHRSHQPPPRDQALLEMEEAAIPLITPAGGGDFPAISGVQPVGRSSDAGAEELGEDDLISVAPEARQSSPPPEIEIPVHDDLDFEDDDEAADMPASSKRPRVPSTMEEALAAAPLEEHDVPIKTPPPESGPQEAAPPVSFEPQRVPDIREAFERDVGPSLDLGPRPEQLGDTIELPEPSNAHLELDVRAPEIDVEVEVEPVSEELEVLLPSRDSSSGYDAGLAVPASAREEIRRYDEQGAALSAPAEATQVVRRRDLSGATASRFASAVAEFTPRTFTELLEASLRLGSE